MSDSTSSHCLDLLNDSYKWFTGAATFLICVYMKLVHENVCRSLPRGQPVISTDYNHLKDANKS